jgi:pheromone shutdown protein TraB
MKGLLVNFARESAALLWVCFVGPWIARLCGIPVQAAFWKMDRQTPRLTRLQFVWAFGVLVCGVGISIFNFDSDIIQRVLLEKRWSAKLSEIGFELAISVFMGIVIGFVCAPTQIGETPVTTLDLSRRK